MIIGITEGFGLVLLDVPDVVLGMLREVPAIVAADGGLPGAVDPVAGAPADDKECASVREMWATVVRPELVESFRGELDTLQEDLAAAEPCEPDPEEAVDHPGSDFFRLWIGPDRVEAWHGALNQARLALAARFAFGNERECATRYQSWPLDKREAFGRARVYGAIQQGLLSCLEGQFGG